jgi:SAM-dependent methyltransferase
MLTEKVADFKLNNPILLDEYRKYAEKSYPSNHTYKILNKELRPKCKLSLRYQRIKKLFPEKLTSMIDVGCSKGFFVFAANQQHGSQRNIGIDIDQYDITFCRAIKKYLNMPCVRFELMKLHELAERINEFGGPFQTVLLINVYQYLYFGSTRSDAHYRNHDQIFQHLRRICSHRLIFNNRVNLVECQNVENTENELTENYNEKKIIESASRYFSIKKYGFIGRYPLWAMDC